MGRALGWHSAIHVRAAQFAIFLTFTLGTGSLIVAFGMVHHVRTLLVGKCLCMIPSCPCGGQIGIVAFNLESHRA